MTVEKEIEYNLTVFKIFSRHDFLIVFIFLSGVYFFSYKIGLFITFIPFLEFFSSYRNSQPLPANLKSELKSQFPFARKVIFRDSGEKVSQAFSLPFLKMVFLSRETINSYLDGNENSKSYARGIVAHELGHLNQYDRVIIRLLQVIIGVISITFFSVFYSDIYVPLNISWRFVYSPDTIRGLVAICIMAFVLASIFHRISHRREFIADLYALKTHPNDILYFLRTWAKSEKRRNKKPFWGGVTHPTFLSRLDACTSTIPFELVHARQIAFQWFALFFLCDFYFGGSFVYSLYVILTYVLLLFVLIWTLVSLPIDTEFRGITRKIIGNYAIGLIIGFVLLYPYVLIVEHQVELDIWRSRSDFRQYHVFMAACFAFIPAAFASYLDFLWLRKKTNISISSHYYAILSTILIFFVTVVYIIDLSVAKNMVHDYVRENLSGDDSEKLHKCKGKFEGLENSEKIQCLELEKKIINVKMETLREKTLEKLKNDNPLSWFSFYEPFPPIKISPPRLIAEYADGVHKLKSMISEWERVTGKKFLDEHPSMAIVDIPNGEGVFQPLPSAEKPKAEHYFREGEPVSISSFISDRTIWSSIEGICWYKKIYMFRPKKIYCGEPYRKWMSDLYHAETNIGKFSQYKYLDVLEYEFLRDQYEKDYAERVQLYEEEMTDYRARKAELDVIVNAKFNNQLFDLAFRLDEIDKRISELSTN